MMDLISAAREAGIEYNEDYNEFATPKKCGVTLDQLVRLAKYIASSERGNCIKLCEGSASTAMCIAAIKARGWVDEL